MNFQITQGTGTTIGSDSVASVNFQQIKLIDATLGSAAPIGVAANPLQVSLEFANTNANPIFVDGNVTPNPFDDRVTIGTMAAAIDEVIVDCTGISTLGWTTSGNWIGTMTHEVDYGDGQWFIVETLDTNLADDGKPFVVTQWTEALNNDPWITNVAGAKQLRFKFISYTSGSALITTNGSVGTNAVRVYNLTPSILQTTALIKDSDNNDLTSTAGALDVNLKSSDITLAISGNVTVVQPTGTNLHTVVDSGSITVANATLAVTQSGVWSVGRTWTLASGTDSIASVQSGTWNINDISGTISLPTGAATEATLATRLADATFTARINTLGQKTMANSTPVVLASDQTVIPVSQSGAPWSQNITQIAGSAIATAATGIAKVGLTDGSGNAISSAHPRPNVYGINATLPDGPAIDSYGRQRVVGQTVPFALFFSNTNHPLYFNVALTGSGTTSFNSTMGSARLTTTTSATDSVIVQTKRYLRYIPGISTMVAVSGAFGPLTTNLRKRWGYFDTTDGFFFEQTGTDVAITLRTSTSGSPVDTRIPQSAWNIDKLDGTGISGVTLDSSKQNLYIADFVWQGTGRIRFGMINGGEIIYCHEILNSNTLTAPWMKSPSKPGRIEMVNTGVTAGTNNMDVVCLDVIRESDTQIVAPYTFGATRGRTSIVAAATTIPLISIRPKTTFNGLTNRVPVIPIKADIANGNVQLIVQVVLNPTLTGAAFASAGTLSAAEFDIAATAITGGTVIYETYVSATTAYELDLTALSDFAVLGLDIAGSTADILTITVQSTAGNTTVFGGLTWQEYQ